MLARYFSGYGFVCLIGRFKSRVTTILRHGGWLQEGGRNWAGRRGNIDFISRGGRTLCSRRGEGGDRALKVVKKGPKRKLFGVRKFFLPF